MFKKLFVFFFCMIFMISLVSSAPPITEISADTGFRIEPTIKDYIKLNADHEFEIHVFNKTNGVPISSGISCYMHLYFDTGHHIFIGEDNSPSNLFDYSFDVNGTNFTEAGLYQAKFQCNNSVIGGGTEIEFYVNGYGEELTEGRSLNFNFAMVFLMILFLIALIGIFKVEHYTGKFACYWLAHILFVVGTYSVWQFNNGYSIAYTGLAGIFKVLFYVSITSMFPMVLLSIAWIFWMHTMTEEMKSMMDRGMTSEEAWDRSNKSGKGWFKW